METEGKNKKREGVSESPRPERFAQTVMVEMHCSPIAEYQSLVQKTIAAPMTHRSGDTATLVLCLVHQYVSLYRYSQADVLEAHPDTHTLAALFVG